MNSTFSINNQILNDLLIMSGGCEKKRDVLLAYASAALKRKENVNKPLCFLAYWDDSRVEAFRNLLDLLANQDKPICWRNNDLSPNKRSHLKGIEDSYHIQFNDWQVTEKYSDFHKNIIYFELDERGRNDFRGKLYRTKQHSH